MCTLHLLAVSHLSLAWCCLKKEQRLSKAAGTALWCGQRGSAWSSRRLSFPSLSPGAPSMPPGFDSWGSDTVILDMRLSTWQCWTRSCSAISGWGKKARRVDGYLKGGGVKHYITCLHKYKQKKSMCSVSGISSRSHLINKCRENLFCPYILPLTVGCF